MPPCFFRLFSIAALVSGALSARAVRSPAQQGLVVAAEHPLDRLPRPADAGRGRRGAATAWRRGAGGAGPGGAPHELTATAATRRRARCGWESWRAKMRSGGTQRTTRGRHRCRGRTVGGLAYAAQRDELPAPVLSANRRRGRRPAAAPAGALPVAGRRLQAVPAALPVPGDRPAARAAQPGPGPRHARARRARAALRAARRAAVPAAARELVGPVWAALRARRRSWPSRSSPGPAGPGAGGVAGVRRSAAGGLLPAGGPAPARAGGPRAAGRDRARRRGCCCAATSTGSTSPPTGQVRVVDYKTGAAPRQVAEVRALFQMKFYALALLHLRGVVPTQLRLLYLADGESLTYQPDEAELRRFERTLDAIWQAILRAGRTGDFRPNPGRMCEWCSHRALCPAWDGTPPAYPGWPDRSAAAATAESALGTGRRHEPDPGHRKTRAAGTIGRCPPTPAGALLPAARRARRPALPRHVLHDRTVVRRRPARRAAVGAADPCPGAVRRPAPHCSCRASPGGARAGAGRGGRGARSRLSGPGASVELLAAELIAGGRAVLRARAWRMATGDTAAVAVGAAEPLPPPERATRARSGHRVGCPVSSTRVEWRWLRSWLGEPGPGGPGRGRGCRSSTASSQPAAAAGRGRRLGQRRGGPAGPAGVAVRQHRAHGAPAPRAAGRVDRGGRGDRGRADRRSAPSRGCSSTSAGTSGAPRRR